MISFDEQGYEELSVGLPIESCEQPLCFQEFQKFPFKILRVICRLLLRFQVPVVQQEPDDGGYPYHTEDKPEQPGAVHLIDKPHVKCGTEYAADAAADHPIQE